MAEETLRFGQPPPPELSQDEQHPEQMHIAIAGNGKVLSGMELLIYSTMLHNRDVIWHVMTGDLKVDNGDGTGTIYGGISETDCEWLRKIVKFCDYRSDLIRHDVSELYDQTIAMSVNRGSGFTPYTALRLLSDLAFPDLDTVFYLDSDIIVQGDIRPPYLQYRWSEYDYAAYTIPDACQGEGEMVGGVLVLNLRQCRKSGFLHRARKYYIANQYRWMDQEALRDAGGKLGDLQETYHYLRDHKMATYKPVILHFCCDNKFKIYTAPTIADFFRYYPEHKYLKDGIDIIRSVG